MADSLPGPVVIAVDELDKMSDAARVADLLRDIKGIFEVPGVYFLVSLSDEAARSLELGTVQTRNEFNSSFYTVISLACLEPDQGVDLLRLRVEGFDEALAQAIGILTGGIPREIVRVAETVYAGIPAETPVAEAVVKAMQDEINAFLAETLVPERRSEHLATLNK